MLITNHIQSYHIQPCQESIIYHMDKEGEMGIPMNTYTAGLEHNGIESGQREKSKCI